MVARIEFDEPKCIAAGQCVMTAPEVFDQRDEDGVAIVLEPEPSAEHLDAVRDAVAICPAAALLLVER
ncbi:ferredoxin [Actinoplanes sp. L3-i22]|uniref:ferredoxin n=1 Tax=Actinoplanes sp. L3-i22 TaxID=2836373 RepID=UPI001C78C98B|nr:ferredoxin [Actinoplanes sp. L3-i22]BCY10130.1 ferredoxin [Actinoplanes sp. L3-i22]